MPSVASKALWFVPLAIMLAALIVLFARDDPHAGRVTREAPASSPRDRPESRSAHVPANVAGERQAVRSADEARLRLECMWPAGGDREPARVLVRKTMTGGQVLEDVLEMPVPSGQPLGLRDVEELRLATTAAWAMPEAELVLMAPFPPEITLGLRPFGSLQLDVLDVGPGVAEIRIERRPGEDSSRLQAEGRWLNVDEPKQLVFHNLRPGQYDISFTPFELGLDVVKHDNPKWRGRDRISVTVVGGQVTEAIIPALGAMDASLRGRVRRSGEPQAGITVQVEVDRYRSAAAATTDEHGFFTLSVLGTGKARLSIPRHTEPMSIRPLSFEIELLHGDQEIDVEIPGSSLRGRVIAESRDELPPFVMVEPARSGDGEPPTSGDYVRADVSSSGEYEVGSLPEGPYWVSVPPPNPLTGFASPGARSGAIQVEVLPGPQVTFARPLRLLETAAVRGVVQRADVAEWAPSVEGTLVLARTAMSGQNWRLVAVADDAGRWDAVLPGGRYEFVARSYRGAPAITLGTVQHEVGVDGSEALLTLTPCVASARCSAIAGGVSQRCKLEVALADGRAVPPRGGWAELAHVQSTKLLPAGRYTFRLTTEAGDSMEKTVDLASGVVEVEFALSGR